MRGGWSTALRIAWRDARRHRARSALVLVLIALPVLVVSTAVIVGRTADVRGVEAIDRTLGGAEAKLWTGGGWPVLQQPDPENGYQDVYVDDAEDREEAPVAPGAAEVVAVLGDDVEVVERASAWSDVAKPNGDLVSVNLEEADFTSPLLDGLVELVAGRMPEAATEVVVTEPLRDAGFGIGDRLPVVGLDEAPLVVGVVEDAVSLQEAAYGPAGSLIADRQGWATVDLFVGGAPVTWPDVQALNEKGFVVASRAVLTDPPSDDEVPYLEEFGYADPSRGEAIAVAAMVVAMVLIEVVLLAGPSFAVTARNHTRTLALVAASGGTPRQARRVILAGALVLGLVATLGALLLSLPLALAVLPLAQRLSWERFGPLDVPWLWLVAIGAFGLTSALLAAVVPAWLTSRQDPVAALAGRRSDRAPDRRAPLLGVLVLGVGIGLTSWGALHYDGLGPALMTGGAVVSMLGMILVVPMLVVVAARVAGRMPLPLRYATRDAARHRTRTVPAVAAVAATVAGVVALGIANASDEAEVRDTYRPVADIGTGLVSRDHSARAPEARPPWDEVEAAARRAAPDLEVRQARGLVNGVVGTDETYWEVRVPEGDPDTFLLSEYGGFYPSTVLVDDDPFLALPAEELAEVEAVLAEGRVAVLTDQGVEADEIQVVRHTYSLQGGSSSTDTVATLPARTVAVSGPAQVEAVVPTALADELGDAVDTVALTLAGPVDRDADKAIEQAVRGVDPQTSVKVERGYQRDPISLVLLWLLAVAGGALMLGGTLTATFLSLGDARPDLATVSAVGGAPRTRRWVAASYALVIALLGAVLGAAVGFVPGIAVARPLTSGYSTGLGDPVGPYLEIPWLMIGAVVVLLPLLAAGVVWLSARSRLPRVARID